ncbi:MAG TPA: DegV family protein [Bacillota bacterium]|nr:DegV family protein [Bacillota bacterium]
MKINILADSACDLSSNQLHAFDFIDVVPLSVHVNNNDYRDGVDIKPKEIYDKMRNGAAPKTSQVTPQTFQSIFTTYAKKNEPLVYLAFSSELSGTFQTAKMMEAEVKETYPEAQIHVIDTKCASIGYGLVVLRACQLVQENASLDEVIETATYYANHMEHIFTVDDLEYLYRGGRVSKTAAFVGSLLRIKPLLHVDDGKLIPLEKIRGSKRVLSRMLDIMEERGTDFNNQTVGISHGDDLETAQKLANLIKERFAPKDIIIEMVGAVIGAHSGPGTIALFFLNDQAK